MLEIVFIQTLEININQMTVQKIHHITKTGTTQTIIIYNTQIIDYQTTQTTDQTIIIIKIDHLTIPSTKILIIQIDNKITLSHHIGIIHQYQSSQQNFRSSTPKHQRQINQVHSTEEIQSDNPGIGNTENSELQVNHINCESTDDDSETENTLSKNMLQIENEYETPIKSSCYQIIKIWKILKTQITQEHNRLHGTRT